MSVIRWFATNRVAANLLMGLVLFGGVTTIFSVRQEVFPEFSLDRITVGVEYLGAAPEEVEEAVCIRIEEAVQDLDGVKQLTSTAAEGFCLVAVELTLEADARRVLDDVKARVDAIDTFPEETEKPLIQEVTNRRQVIDVAVHGDAGERTLRAVAERVRDDLTALPGITLAELANVRPYEISIEVAERELRRHGLTIDQVAAAVRRSSLDLPGGSVRTPGGEVLLRAEGQAERQREFERLPVITRPDGTRVTVGAVAEVIDGFAETDQASRFDGRPAVLIEVFRTGDQDALAIADQVQDYVERAEAAMPEGIHLETWNDAARVLRGRRDLLLKNGATGMLLVVATLALFLRFRLAFWVALGMAISFLGAIWLMPVLDVSINLISLFAFILVLGIVVDDAIVVGENIHTHQHRRDDPVRGAVEGAQEVALPVIFAVLTTVAAFAPLLAVPGTTGKVMRVIPLIVIPCLVWSLVESLWILPAHLSHGGRTRAQRERERHEGGFHPWRRFHARFAGGLRFAADRMYVPSLELALRWRYLTVAAALAALLVTGGLVQGGFVSFVFFPEVESDFVSAAVTMPQGTPVELTAGAVAQLERSAERLRGELREATGEPQVQHMFSAIGEQPFRRTQQQNAGGTEQRTISSHLGEVTLELTPAEQRNAASAEVSARWRELTGSIPDALELDFTASLFQAGEDVNVQLTGPDTERLGAAAEALKQRLGQYAGVYEISDSFLAGKQEIELDIAPAAETLGLTLSDLARQVRQAFYGEEAQRIQRGRDDVRVMVRYPERARRSLESLESMRIRTPEGDEVPFREVARVERGRGYAAITRVDRRRAVNVTADVDPGEANAGEIIADLEARVLPELLADYPGVDFTFEGQQAEQRETLGGLVRGFALALVVIYALLAVPLRSYTQPLLIMSAIPFGLVGAVWGHVLMRMDLTILSMFGLVALTGVVVNDSLVMVDFINRHRRTEDERLDAVRKAGRARFRAILLTSITTFVGLFPLMIERSMQARFLIPMAVSLAFGVLFATFITLVLVPAGALILDDMQRGVARARRWLRGEPRERGVGTAPP